MTDNTTHPGNSTAPSLPPAIIRDMNEFLHTYPGAIATGVLVGAVVACCCAYLLLRVRRRYRSLTKGKQDDHQLVRNTERSDEEDDDGAFSIGGDSVDLYHLDKWPVVAGHERSRHPVPGTPQAIRVGKGRSGSGSSRKIGGKPPPVPGRKRGTQQPQHSSSSSDLDIGPGYSRRGSHSTVQRRPPVPPPPRQTSSDDGKGVRKWASDTDAGLEDRRHRDRTDGGKDEANFAEYSAPPDTRQGEDVETYELPEIPSTPKLTDATFEDVIPSPPPPSQPQKQRGFLSRVPQFLKGGRSTHQPVFSDS